MLGALLASAPAMAAEQPDEVAVQRWWGEATGLMVGIAVIHGVQPLAAAAGQLGWTDKFFVATAGFGIYSASAIGIGLQHKWGLYIAIGGPALGFTAVMTGFTLYSAGVIDTAVTPDVFQLAGALMQVPCALRAWQLLRKEPKWHSVRLQPTFGRNSLGVTGRF